MLQLRRVATYRIGLGQQPDDAAIEGGIDHCESLCLGAIEGEHRFLDRHARQQYGSSRAQKTPDRFICPGFRRVSIRYPHHAGIATLFVNGNHMGRRAEREGFAEGCDGRRGGDCPHVMTHHPADGEIPHPTNVGGATDRLAAQMEAPGGE